MGHMAAQSRALEGTSVESGDDPCALGRVFEDGRRGHIEFCGEQMFAPQVRKFDIAHGRQSAAWSGEGFEGDGREGFCNT